MDMIPQAYPLRIQGGGARRPTELAELGAGPTVGLGWELSGLPGLPL
jgi:hypothetical protein